MEDKLISGSKQATEELVSAVRNMGHELQRDEDLDPLIDRIGDAILVLIGEASHGTSDFYIWRAQLTRRLIAEHGFSFVAVEGDWPDCYNVNRYVKNYPNAGDSAFDVLQTFDRWPTWMWANWEVVAFAEWLESYNQESGREGAAQVGFYGIDVYSLWESMSSIIEYLSDNAPDALEAARHAYLCFEPYGEDAQSYAWHTSLVPESCESEVIELLSEVRRNAQRYPGDPEAAFDAEQNARVAVEAERYYRTMVSGGAASWNVRDRHMVDTLERLMDHHQSMNPYGATKAVVWEHNTHVGDARATDMAGGGMVNVGQLMRENNAQDDVVLIGFGSNSGRVIAGSEWGASMQKMDVPDGKEGSWENILHEAYQGDRLILMDDMRANAQAMATRGHRAIGVIYDPERDSGNYVPTVLPARYDALLYLDRTEALHPLHPEPETDRPPELYPWGV